MQTNLQSTTFNKHNYIKNDRLNQRKNPFINNISNDLSYKSHSITDAPRNPLHLSAGPEYLYFSRIEQLKRMLKQKQITLIEYNQAVRKIELAMNMPQSNIQPPPQSPPVVVTSNSEQQVTTEQQPPVTTATSSANAETDISQMSDKEVIKMISTPPTYQQPKTN